MGQGSGTLGLWMLEWFAIGIELRHQVHSFSSGVQWLTPVTPAMQEAQVEGLWSQASPGQKHKTLSEK
jgi:hypothetical protein